MKYVYLALLRRTVRRKMRSAFYVEYAVRKMPRAWHRVLSEKMWNWWSTKSRMTETTIWTPVKMPYAAIVVQKTQNDR